MHGNHIHIALAEDQIFFPCGPGNVQPVKIPAFIKNLCFRRVEIFRLRISHNASAKANDPVIYIHDRKDHPVPEFIIHSVPFVHIKKPRLSQPVIRIAFGFQIAVQASAGPVRIPQPELSHSLLAESPVFQIIKTCLTFFCAKLIIKILRRLFIDLQKLCFFLSLLSDFSGVFDLRKLHPRPVCQML